MSEHVRPHSLDAERAVLGGVLVDNDLFDVAAGILGGPNRFYREAHGRIWRALASLREKSIPPDLVTLVEELDRRGDLERVGGPAYVSSLTDGMPRASNIEHHARIVRDKFTLCRLIDAANVTVEEAYRAEQEADLLVDRAERRIMDVGQASTPGEFVLAEDWMRDVHAQIEKAALAKRMVTGIPSGLPKLDRWTRGWQKSDLIYLGARPSAGKTSMALQLALEASKHAMTGFVSLEMSRRVLGMRAVALEAGVDAFRLMTGHLSEFEMQRVGAALGSLGERRLAIDDATGLTATQLRAKVRRLASRYGLDIVFIDYMQLLQDDSGAENRNLELSRISAGLKSLARELDIPVFVLSQLSRTSAKENRRPQVSDLRDSGSLEQDADVVLLLHRPNQGDTVKFENEEAAELIIGKQRNGPTGVVHLRWVGEQMRFGEAALEGAA